MKDPKDNINYKVDVVKNGYVICSKPQSADFGVKPAQHVAESKERLKEILMDLVTADINEIVEDLPSNRR